jgi:hypothetical protein
VQNITAHVQAFVAVKKQAGREKRKNIHMIDDSGTQDVDGDGGGGGISLAAHDVGEDLRKRKNNKVRSRSCKQRKVYKQGSCTGFKIVCLLIQARLCETLPVSWLEPFLRHMLT